MNITKSYNQTGEKVLREEKNIERINQELLGACRDALSYLAKDPINKFAHEITIIGTLEEAISRAEGRGEK